MSLKVQKERRTSKMDKTFGRNEEEEGIVTEWVPKIT